MAHLHRLIVYLALLIVQSAYAFPQQALWQTTNLAEVQGATGDTAERSCQIMLAKWAAARPPSGDWSLGPVTPSGNGYYCVFLYKGSSNGAVGVTTHRAGNACPANSTSDGAGGCMCSPGFKETTNPGGAISCEEDKPPTADEACAMHSFLWNAWKGPEDRMGIVENRTELSMSEPFQVCMPMTPEDFGGDGGPNAPPGCKHMFTPQMRYRMSSDDPWRYEGDSWALGPNDKPQAGGTLACVPGLDEMPGVPPDLPRVDEPTPGCEGGIPGQVNGVDVCLDPSAGRTEGVNWTQVTDAEGRTREIREEVKCEGEKCTVTTHNKVPGEEGPGNVTTTTTTRGQYCAKNPESPVCKGDKDRTGSTRNQNGRGGAGDPAAGGGSGGGGDGDGDGDGDGEPSSFGGSCMAGFSCDGDAIQCAIAREQHIRACKLFDDPTDESRLYDAEKVKDPNRDVTANLPGNETIDVSGRISYDDVLGGGACIADLNIQVMQQSVTLPISRICPELGYLGYVLVAVASLVAARIVTGTSKD